MLDVKHPVTYGAVDLQDYYTEHKRQQAEGCRRRGRDPARGRALREAHRPLLRQLRDAPARGREVGILSLSSRPERCARSSTSCRDEGIKVGGLKLRVFRPFPAAELAAALGHLKVLAVLDRADSFARSAARSSTRCARRSTTAPQRPRVVNSSTGSAGAT